MESSTTGADGLGTIRAEKSEIKNRPAQDQQDPEIHSLAANDSVQAEPSKPNRGVKRPAEEDVAEEDDVELITSTTTLSKNQQKKLKRQNLWEEGQADRAAKRKEKRHNKQERRRLEKEAARAEGREPDLPKRERDRDPRKQTKVPVSIIVDCQYERYMRENELISLCSQVTRCYSDNRSATFPVHLYISSYGGNMKERYETKLQGQINQWKNIAFEEEDFVKTAAQAREKMARDDGGKIVDVLHHKENEESSDAVALVKQGQDAEKKKDRNGPAPIPEPEADDVDKSIVYLTADSPYVLERLEPNTSYVVGGIIDRNREKGLCYKVARERKVRTAKLPIGEYMVLRDRHVLATNHVVEIMLRWLELGDWGAAFMKVIPQRKGGELKSAASEAGEKEVEADQ